LLFAVYLDDIAKSYDGTQSLFSFYADDILRLSATVTGLQNMLYNCEREFDA